MRPRTRPPTVRDLPEQKPARGPMTQTSKASVIVTWDRAGLGAMTDTCGPAAASWLSAHGFAVGPIESVASEWSDLTGAVTRAVADGQHLVTICGGVGLGIKDISPQVAEKISDHSIPGLGELWRRESLKYSLSSYLSRSGGWVKDGTLILAIPGSAKAAVEYLGIVGDLLPLALKGLRFTHDHHSEAVEGHA